MTIASKRKTSLTLDAATLELARDLGINVSAVADTALQPQLQKRAGASGSTKMPMLSLPKRNGTNLTGIH